MPAPPSTHVQYGCGLSCPAGWLNFDSSPTLRIQRIPLLGRLSKGPHGRFPRAVRYGDIVKGLPLPDGSVRGVYASHVLEHMALEDCRRALANTLRLLAPGGIFRLLVPDLAALVEKYRTSPDADACSVFMDHSMLGQRVRPRGLAGRVRDQIGNAPHRWMWDEKGMAAELAAAGFVAVRPCRLGDCEDPAFALAEDAGRFDAAVALEARRAPGPDAR